MQTTADIAVALVVLLPFAAAAAMPLLQRLIGSLAGWVAALVPAVGFVALWGDLDLVSEGSAIAIRWPWAPSLRLSLSFWIDGLSLVFSLTIAGIGALVLLYSAAYLRGEPHQGRFLSFLLMFIGAMQGLVLADSTVALYLFWELTSVASFLLIGFEHSRQAARRAATQALVVTGIGGLALLAAGVVIQSFGTGWELSAAGDLRGNPAYPLLVGLVLLAAFTKSAQWPFHFWLPNAMEAPTPVSAYLHSAAMVQAGVYLVARLTPNLGGEPLWNVTLMAFGGLTLLWGAVAAIRQTDLKQLLAQTTLASLGLTMLLLGTGTELAVTGAVLYFIAHALYKAGLFMVAGAIDRGTGTRDITALGGLRDPMTVSFIGTIMAAAAMIGLPPLVGFFAKEEMYAALALGRWDALLALAALVAGNAVLAAVALALLIKPFMGTLLPTPKPPREAPVAMLAGPVALGVLGIFLGFVPQALGGLAVAPAVSAILGNAIESHLELGLDPLAPALWLSIATWVLAGLLFWRLEAARGMLRRFEAAFGWSFDKGFDRVYFGLVRLAGALTRLLHHGRLELYLIVVFLMLGLAALGPLVALDGLASPLVSYSLTFYEWGVVLIALIGLYAVMIARTRLISILALGVQGLAVSLLYLLFGAPDLSFTQFMVEILSVVILTLVMTRLRLDGSDPRPLEDWLRDGAVALFAGGSVTAVLFAVLDHPLDLRLSAFFDANSAPLAHGRNVVNVILVDFRGLDTLGEISVVMTAGIAILALIRGARKATPTPPAAEAPARKPRRRRAAA